MLPFQIYGENQPKLVHYTRVKFVHEKTKPLESGYLVYFVGKEANDDRKNGKERFFCC